VGKNWGSQSSTKRVASRTLVSSNGKDGRDRKVCRKRSQSLGKKAGPPPWVRRGGGKVRVKHATKKAKGKNMGKLRGHNGATQKKGCPFPCRGFLHVIWHAPGTTKTGKVTKKL